MNLNYHDKYRPCNDVVFGIMFADKHLFCTLVEAVTGTKIEINGEVHSQATKTENDALLNNIRFDTLAETTTGQFYSLDMQRRHDNFEVNMINRSLYYACRAISTQKVKKMDYASLKPVTIAFVFPKHESDFPTENIVLYNETRGEIQTELLSVRLVNVPAVLRNGSTNENLKIFSQLFTVSSSEDAATFADTYSKTELGKELIMSYNQATRNIPDLVKIDDSEYFVERLTEEEIEEERQKSKLSQTIADAKAFLKLGVSPDIVAKGTKLPLDTVRSLMA